MASNPFEQALKAFGENPMVSLATGATRIDHPIETESGGGLVKVTINQEGVFSSIAIDPMLLDKENVHHLEQLLKAAINDARTKFQTELNKIAKDQMLEHLPSKDQLGAMVSEALSKLKP